MIWSSVSGSTPLSSIAFFAAIPDISESVEIGICIATLFDAGDLFKGFRWVNLRQTVW
jgi:hypothetical protein